MKGCWFDLAGTPRKKTGPLSAELLVLLCLALLCPLAARPQSPKAEGEAAGYAERAREAVLEELHRLQLPVEEFRVEVVGVPVLLPEHAHLHRPPPVEPAGAAAVRGHVVDPTGAPIPHAHVTFLAEGERMGKVVPLDPRGHFELVLVQPGRYELWAEHSGFRRTVHKVHLKPNENRRITVLLEIGATSDVFIQGDLAIDSAAVSKLPRAFVVVLAHRNDQGDTLFRVQFMPERVDVANLLRLNNSYLNRELRFDEGEWHQVTAELASFYDVALDITLGPERFYPYLPEDMHSGVGFPKSGKSWLGIPMETVQELSDGEVRRLVGAFFDWTILRGWLEFEGLLDHWLLMESPGLDQPHNPDNIRSFTDEVLQHVTGMKKELRNLGALNPDHLRAIRPYLHYLMGEGLVNKESNEMGLKMPVGAPLYRARLALLYPFLARQGNKLKIVTFQVGN